MSFLSELRNHLRNHGTYCALADAEGRILGGNGQTGSSLLTEHAHCNLLFHLHDCCSCGGCHIRQVFATQIPVARELHHPQLGSIALHILPLSGSTGPVELATLHIHAPSSTAATPPRYLNSLPVAVIECDLRGRLLFANSHCAELFSMTENRRGQGLDLARLASGDDRPRLAGLLAKAVGRGRIQSAEFIAAAGGRGFFAAIIHLIPITRDGAVSCLCGIIENMSPPANGNRQPNDRERRHHCLAHHDLPSGLPDRDPFMIRLGQIREKAACRQKPLALMMLDLDRPQQVGDGPGCDWDDRVAGEIARRLEKLIRHSDALGRLTSGAFVLLYNGVSSPASLSLLVRRLKEALRQPVPIGEHAVHVTASIGIASFRHPLKEAETMLRQVAIAMAEAKRQGGNCCIYFRRELHHLR